MILIGSLDKKTTREFLSVLMGKYVPSNQGVVTAHWLLFSISNLCQPCLNHFN